jgi:hypothetical protein
VAANVSAPLADRLRSVASRLTSLGHDRYTIELPLTHPPDRIVPDITAAGATLISLNPLRATLEEFFVEKVAEAGAGARAAAERSAGARR